MIIIANLFYLYFLIPVLVLFTIYRWFIYKKPLYLFSSLKPFESIKEETTKLKDYFLLFLRFASLLTLVFAIARFQKPDDKTKISVEGIDIMMVLDVSGSMQLFDDQEDPRSRIDVAVSEAKKFIQKRENDPIGLVFFGKFAFCRSPLTLDKNILKDILTDTKIGIINPEGTVLSRAILTAVNRLKNSQAKSKIIILLTDGEPSQDDIDPKIALDAAKKLGIKIYTIGIGSENYGFYQDPLWGFVPVQSKLNIDLLKLIAQETSGQFFLAKSPKDMEEIYSTIDQLERTKQETPIYSKYYEYFIIFLWISFILLIIELIFKSIFWLSL